MKTVTFDLSDQALQETCLQVLETLSPSEVDVARIFLGPLIRMAEGGELAYVDQRDPGGGFGPSDPLFLTLVPVMVGVFKGLREGLNRRSIVAQLPAEIRRIANAVDSTRGLRQADDIVDAIRKNLEHNTFDPGPETR